MDLRPLVDGLKLRWEASSDRASLVFLIGANAVALAGVLGFGWASAGTRGFCCCFTGRRTWWWVATTS